MATETFTITQKPLEQQSDSLLQDLWKVLALRFDYANLSTCVAWVDSRDTLCGKTAHSATPMLCKRHANLALKRAYQALAERKSKEGKTVIYN